MSKKLVEKEYLKYMVEELFFIKLQCHSKIQERIDNLLKYIEINIIQSEQESRNETKKVVYKLMKDSKTDQESTQWYKYYKDL